MRPHPDCIHCDGSGYCYDTIGAMKHCWCVVDKNYRSELDAKTVKKTEQIEQKTEWDIE